MSFRLLFLMFGILAFSNQGYSQRLVINEVGFKLEDDVKRQISLLAEYEAQIYNGLFDTRRNDSLLITINIYKKFSDYKKSSLNTGGKPISATGFYSPYQKQVFVYKHDDFMRTLVHEMSHCFMHDNMGPEVPRWLNEGVAVFFESMEVKYNEVSVTVQAGRLSAVRKYVADGDFDLVRFFQTPGTLWLDKSKLDYLYNVSYSIVFFLMRSNPAAARKLIRELSKEKDSVRAIERLPYGRIDQFEARYKLFYR
ncbi:DUF1570 domain-containing protein [Pararcticibacter amylolyticus]|nr:DUF1570 domain-containing protein [Pararcticibacter amylolyticus]